MHSLCCCTWVVFCQPEKNYACKIYCSICFSFETAVMRKTADWLLFIQSHMIRTYYKLMSLFNVMKSIFHNLSLKFFLRCLMTLFLFKEKPHVWNLITHRERGESSGTECWIEVKLKKILLLPRTLSNRMHTFVYSKHISLLGYQWRKISDNFSDNYHIFNVWHIFEISNN